MGSTLDVRTAGNAKSQQGLTTTNAPLLKRLGGSLQRLVGGPWDSSSRKGATRRAGDEAGVGKALLEDKLAEVAIWDNDNPLLVSGDGKYIFIGKPVRIVAGDGANVMAERLQVGMSRESALWSKRNVIGWHRVSPLGWLRGDLPAGHHIPA